MTTFEDEVLAARVLGRNSGSGAFTRAQLARWRGEARARQAWTHAHPRFHHALNVLLVSSLVMADGLLGRCVARSMAAQSRWLVVGTLSLMHGWLLYAFTHVSLHEGAGHDRLILGRGLGARVGRVLLNNVCRLGYADPRYYRSTHPSHHGQLGTRQDRAFTHVVRPGRVLRSLLPFAGVMPFNDFRIHAGGPYGASRALSDGLGTAWSLLGAVLLAPSLGWPWALAVQGCLGPWAAFTLDRLRETVEHAGLETDSPFAARSLGLGVWGWALAPGPFGQCSHLVHHLAPGLPWYQQALMHRHLVRELGAEQRRLHLLPGGILGYPRFFIRVLRESGRALRSAEVHRAR